MSQLTSKLLLFLAILSFSLTEAHANVAFSNGTDAASVDEASAMKQINRFRADPRGELTRMVNELTGTTHTPATLAALLSGQATHTANWWSTNFNGPNGLTNNLDGFSVVPATLQTQFSALPLAGALYPYTWDNNIGWAANQYANCVEQDAGTTADPHSIPGAPGLGARFTDSGYAGWSNVGENIAPNFQLDINFIHAGFAIDWGTGIDGIQVGAGHRNNMLSDTFTEIGIGIIDNGWDSPNVTQVQHFSTQFADAYLRGYVSSTPTYDLANALAGSTVQLKDNMGNLIGGSVVADMWGGYSIDVSGLNLAGGTTYQVMAMNGGVAASNAFVYSAANRVNRVNVAVPEPSAFVFFALIAGIGGSWRFRRFLTSLPSY